ncbi:hypothetical protein ACLOJK_002793 [Asimina triloba]
MKTSNKNDIITDKYVNSALTTTIVGVLKGVGSTFDFDFHSYKDIFPGDIELHGILATNSLSMWNAYLPTLRNVLTLGFVLLGGVQVHALNVTGLVINTAGGVWYSYAKYQQKKSRPRKLISDVEAAHHK